MSEKVVIGNATLYLGDCLDVLKTLPTNSVDSVVCDPPYGLSFMGKKWDYDVPSVEIWAECLRVLKPGGHLLAFAGTRTQHRMAVRIEDAGFEIRDMIAWVYGSGFPKSLDVSKALDKAAGAEREVVGPNRFAALNGKARHWSRNARCSLVNERTRMLKPSSVLIWWTDTRLVRTCSEIHWASDGWDCRSRPNAPALPVPTGLRWTLARRWYPRT